MNDDDSTTAADVAAPAASAPAASLSPSALTPHRRILEVNIGIDRVVEALQLKALGDDPNSLTPSREVQMLSELVRQQTAGEELNMALAMKSAGLILPEILDLLHRADVALALTETGRRVGRVLDGLGEAAEPKWAICDTCMGDGQVSRPDPSDESGDPAQITVTCPEPRCQNGKIRIMGDLDAAKLFLVAHGIGAKSGGSPGTVVNVAAQAGVKIDRDDVRSVKAETITSRVQKILEGGS